MLRKINLKSDFLKSVMILTSGTVLAQIIHLALNPFILDLYSDVEIGELNYLLRITGFIAAIGTARYELSIPLPKTNAHAFQLLRLSLKIGLYTLLASVLAGLIYWMFDGFNSDVGLYIVAIVVVSALVLFRNTYVSWSIRMKLFKLMSTSKVSGAIGMNVFKIGFGLLKLGTPGLILATIFGIISGTVLYFINFFKTKKDIDLPKSRAKEYVLAKEHKDFPMVNLPHTLLDTGRDLLIAVFIGYYFGKGVWGSYSQISSLLAVPLILIGTTMGQAFFQKSAQLFSDDKPIYPLLKRTTIILLGLSLIPFSIVYFFGEELFVWYANEEWRFAGKVGVVLVPWMMIRFIASPISTIPLVIKKQKIFFWLGLGNTVIQLVAVGILPMYFSLDEEGALALLNVMSITLAIYLSFVIFAKLKLVKQSDKQKEQLV